jgi:hypothetical protein
MRIRKTVPTLMILVAGGAAAPVLADCCSGILSCAATVVTYGVSCEVQTIIDTLNDIKNALNTFMGAMTGSTQFAEQAARDSVTNTLNSMQSQSQQAASDLAAALSQAQLITKEEKTIIDQKEKSQVNQNLLTATPSSPSGPKSSIPPSVQAQGHQPRTEQAANGADSDPTNPLLHKGTVEVDTQVSITEHATMAPHGEFADTFSSAVKQIEALKSAGDSDLNSVNRYLAQAQSSEGPGDTQADNIISLMFSPLTAISVEIDTLLSDPLKAFDPSSIVDSMESTFMANLTSNVNQMVAAITSGPDQAFSAAQPTYDDLLAKAEGAQALAAAMTLVYQKRTPAAAEALYALLPKTEYAALANNVKAQSNITQPSGLASKFGQRQSYAVIAARMSTAQQRALQAFRKPDTSQLQAAIVRFKAQRAAGKSPLPQATLAGYQNTLKQQLDGNFNGKSAAAIANQRDQLIAQARTTFAKDPSTANGVVALLNSEAAKRGTATNLTARDPTIPGQPAPKVIAPNAATLNTAPGMATGTLKQPVAIVAPGNTPVSQATIIQAPATQTPANQTKAPTWGAAPSGWTGPAATAPATSAIRPAVTSSAQPSVGAATSFKSTTTQTTVQPVQQYQQVPQVQPVQPYQPVQPVQPVQQNQPVQQYQPVQPYQPVQQVQQIQQYQPVQQIQPVQPVQQQMPQIAPSTLGH